MAERDDWETIEAWRERTSHEVFLTGGDDGQWCLRLINWGPKCEQRGGPFIGPRAEVVELGAKWCRENERVNRVRREDDLLSELRAADRTRDEESI